MSTGRPLTNSVRTCRPGERETLKSARELRATSEKAATHSKVAGDQVTIPRQSNHRDLVQLTTRRCTCKRQMASNNFCIHFICNSTDEKKKKGGAVQLFDRHSRLVRCFTYLLQTRNQTKEKIYEVSTASRLKHNFKGGLQPHWLLIFKVNSFQ